MNPDEFENPFPFQGIFPPSVLTDIARSLAETAGFDGSIFEPNPFYEGDTELNLELLRTYLLERLEQPFIWEVFVLPRINPLDVFSTTSTVITAARPLVPHTPNTPLAHSSQWIKQFKLNKRRARLHPSPAYSIQFDPKTLVSELGIYFYYEEITSSGGFVANGGEQVVVQVPDRLTAIEIKTESPAFFYHFLMEIDDRDIHDILLVRLLTAYQQLDRLNPIAVNWFYTHALDFILEELSMSDLWQDFQQLLKYDHSSWFKDNSDSLMRVLSAIFRRSDGPGYLHDQFEANPVFTRSVYYSLQGSEEYEGQWRTRRSIFASLLSSLTLAVYTQRELPIESTVELQMGRDIYLDTPIGLQSESENAFDFTQQRRVTNEVNWDIVLSRTQEFTTPQPRSRWVSDPMISLAPLALVRFTRPGSNGLISTVVPAILVKDRAQAQAWEEVEDLLRIGFNILAIATSVASLGGSAFINAIAYLEIGLSVTDLGVQAFKNDLNRTPQGQEFLKLWDQVYTAGSVVTLTAALPQLLRAGGKALFYAGDAGRKLLKEVLTASIIDLNILRSSDTILDIGRFAIKDASAYLRPLALKNLEKAGVVFIKIKDETGQIQYAAVHRGDLLVPPGSAQDVGKALYDVRYRQGRALEKGLKLQKVALRRQLFKEAYKDGFKYYKADALSLITIRSLFGRAGIKLEYTVSKQVEQLVEEAKTLFPKKKKTSLTTKAKRWLYEYQLVAGAVHRNYPDLIILKTNYPKKAFDKILARNKIYRGTTNFNDIKVIYQIFKEEGFIKHSMHPLIEERIIWHMEELKKGLKHPPDYHLGRTGGVPGVHAEILAVNDLLWELEKIEDFKLSNTIFEELVGHNINLEYVKPMIRCADCQLLTSDVPFLEKILKTK